MGGKSAAAFPHAQSDRVDGRCDLRIIKTDNGRHADGDEETEISREEFREKMEGKFKTRVNVCLG